MKVGTLFSVASQGYQPLWLVSQRWGTIRDQGTDLTSYLMFHNEHLIGSGDPFRRYVSKIKRRAIPTISYGISLYNNQYFRKVFIQEGYVKLQKGNWQLAAGRYQETSGETPHQISSGSLGISENALPIPKVGLSVVDYTDIPLLPAGWVQFKGQLSAGWMEKDAYVKKAKFHQRSLYFQVGKKPFASRRSPIALSLFGGLNHFVIWGGEHPEKGKLSGEWKNLTQIIVPGNNLGFFDYGLNFLARGYKLKAYTQVPFEGKGNINPLRIKDRMIGFVLSDTRKGSFFPDVTFEVINTTWQESSSESSTASEDYNFYNNTVYADGWSYSGRILGTSLFFNRQRAIQYFGENYNTSTRYDWNIVNNRINGIHIGAKGQIPYQPLYYRTLFTYTINHGNYFAPGVFNGDNQIYMMQEMAYQYQALRITATLGCDVGSLTQNIGAILGVEYDLNYTENSRKGWNKNYRRRNSSRGIRW
uniref:Capsule assembly Wzi family protein n=1 Tax=Roseihalotalea indica TaxID=2867963 RepID=A0AA49GIW6_9BACT|nr:capsule assembly Wzi family protein [Tunicatimonas sp. TK19036]